MISKQLIIVLHVVISLVFVKSAICFQPKVVVSAVVAEGILRHTVPRLSCLLSARHKQEVERGVAIGCPARSKLH